MRRMDNMDLRLLRIFATLVEAGSFTEAQAELNISQPTLSTHLSTLEQRLGNRLCDRGRKGFRLTPFGSKTYSAAKKLFADIEAFNETMGQQSLPQKRLRLGIIDGVVTNACLGLQRALEAFPATHGDIFISLELGTPEELAAAIADDRMDLAVGPFTSKLDQILYTPIHQELHALYCGKGNELFGVEQDKITRKMLDAARFSVRGYRKLDDIYRVGHPRASAQVSRTEAQLMMILSGRYIGFLPCHAAEPWVERHLLRPLKMGAHSFSSQHYIAYKEQNFDHPQIQDMAKIIKREALCAANG